MAQDDPTFDFIEDFTVDGPPPPPPAAPINNSIHFLFVTGLIWATSKLMKNEK
jgi:hypothetical protein